MRSLGVIIYPDGSQAEVLYVACHPMHGSDLMFKPLAKPRKLTCAPFGLLVSLLCLVAFSLSGCATLQRVGNKPICLLDYDTGIKRCEYDTWEVCHGDLRGNDLCYRR